MHRGFCRRVIHLANLPLKLMLPKSKDNIKEVCFKTVPSASKIEIKRVLESVYGLEVLKVNTINMDGKKKRRGTGLLLANPDYKKAYVILKRPVSLPDNLFPFNMSEADEEQEQEQKSKSHRKK